MTAPAPTDYDNLERESSNLLLERDALLVRGDRSRAAALSRQAGEMRWRMGEQRQAAGLVADAAEDWLSAARCFLDARASQRAGEAITALRPLVEAESLRGRRPDLHRDWQQRVSEWQLLERELEQAG